MEINTKSSSPSSLLKIWKSTNNIPTIINYIFTLFVLIFSVIYIVGVIDSIIHFNWIVIILIVGTVYSFIFWVISIYFYKKNQDFEEIEEGVTTTTTTTLNGNVKQIINFDKIFNYQQIKHFGISTIGYTILLILSIIVFNQLHNHTISDTSIRFKDDSNNVMTLTDNDITDLIKVTAVLILIILFCIIIFYTFFDISVMLFVKTKVSTNTTTTTTTPTPIQAKPNVFTTHLNSKTRNLNN